MYAVICTGAKQFKVKVGDRIKAELLPDTDHKFNVLFLKDKETHIGMPFVPNAFVEAKNLGVVKDKKLIIYKKKKQNDKKTGHRQKHTLLEIVSIGVANGI